MAVVDVEPGGRFQVLRKLGTGGAGIVYEAFDKERGARVALKTLVKLDAAARVHFKREFRALVDLTHGNLVQLYELMDEGDSLSFTMELVEGTDFLEHVWGLPRADTSNASGASTPRDDGSPARQESGRVLRARDGRTRAPRPVQQVDWDRLRGALLQLASAVDAIHAAGKLHRDLKPSNVLVDGAGRVVVVDFGVATDIRDDDGRAAEELLIGTPSYMAPEQCAMDPLGPAADWYAVGCILYRALTGDTPFVGSMMEVLHQKQKDTPLAPVAIAPDVPPDLDEVAVGLLAKDPRNRFASQEIRARIHPRVRDAAASLPDVTPWDAAPPPPVPPGSVSRMSAGDKRVPLVGREAALAAMERALASAESGTRAVVLVEGPSGIGKSLLVRRFLAQVEDGSSAVVLRGRCFERESMPYKAFDDLIEVLAAYLRTLPDTEQAAVMPRGVTALLPLFPILERVPAIAEAPRNRDDAKDAHRQRGRAFLALRELLARLADRRALVLFIDDIQWGDADSTALLRALVSGADAPTMMLILAFRGDERGSSTVLQDLLDKDTGIPADVTPVRVVLDALSEDEARALALALLGPGASPELAGKIAAESAGSPFFVGELVRYVQMDPTRARLEHVKLTTAIRERVSSLRAGTRTLLEIVAVAGRPVRQEVAFLAASLQSDERIAALATLRSGSLLRSQGTKADDAVECFHDRIRETVVRSLSKEALRIRHAELARALVRAGRADPEALFAHFHAAGMTEPAAEYAVVAARKADEALAFDRAAQLYGAAVELGVGEPRELRGFRIARGHALANAGRGALAAEAYDGASKGAPPAEALNLAKRSAEQLLRSGHFDRGLARMHKVLASVRMRAPSGPITVVLTFLFYRAMVRLRGYAFTRRDPDTLTPLERRRIDVCHSAAVGLTLADYLQGAIFQARHLLLALRAGDPLRVAEGLALETAYAGAKGGPAWPRTKRLAERTLALAEETRSEHAIAVASLASGVAHYHAGFFRESLALTERSVEAFRDRCAGASWELVTGQLFGLYALFYLGRIREMSERLPVVLDDAKDRGDLFGVVNFRTGPPTFAWLAADDPARARRELALAMHDWSKQGFHAEHYVELYGQLNVDLYEGKPGAAYARVRDAWPKLRRALLLGVQALRIEATHARGRAALALAEASKEVRGPLLREASAMAKALGKEDRPWAHALSALLRAGVLSVGGDRVGAAHAMGAAARLAAAADMHLYAAIARSLVGELEGGDDAATRAEEAEAFARAEGIQSFASVIRTLAPGFARAPHG